MEVDDLGVDEMGRRRSVMTPFVCLVSNMFGNAVDHLGRYLFLISGSCCMRNEKTQSFRH